MEYGPENNIFVLKMMMKSGLEKIILKFLHAQHNCFYLIKKLKIANSVIKITLFAHGGISKKFFTVDVDMINKTLSQKFHPYSIFTG